MIISSLFADMLKNSENLKEEKVFQYLAMKEAIITDFRTYLGNLELDKALELVRQYLVVTGWGEVNLKKTKDKYKWTVKDSAIASNYLKLYGPTEESLCSALAGALAAPFALKKPKLDFKIEESKCISKKDDICEFIFKPNI